MLNSGHQSATRNRSNRIPRLSRGPVPGAQPTRASEERQALRRAWLDHRHLGDGAIVAAMADIVSRSRLTARNACEPLRLDLDANTLMQDGLRRGWLTRAA